MNTGEITVQELDERIAKNESIILIDVREPFENDLSNLGGTLIPLGTLPDELHQIEAYKNQEIIVYCRSGNRSSKACAYLAEQGFTNVRNLVGGITRWSFEIDPGLPVA